MQRQNNISSSSSLEEIKDEYEKAEQLYVSEFLDDAAIHYCKVITLSTSQINEFSISAVNRIILICNQLRVRDFTLFMSKIDRYLPSNFIQVKQEILATIDNKHYAPYCVRQGVDFLLKNQLDEALKQFQRAIYLDPKIGDAYYGLGLFYLKNERYDLAAENFRKSRQLNCNLSQTLEKITVEDFENLKKINEKNRNQNSLTYQIISLAIGEGMESRFPEYKNFNQSVPKEFLFASTASWHNQPIVEAKTNSAMVQEISTSTSGTSTGVPPLLESHLPPARNTIIQKILAKVTDMEGEIFYANGLRLHGKFVEAFQKYTEVLEMAAQRSDARKVYSDVLASIRDIFAIAREREIYQIYKLIFNHTSEVFLNLQAEFSLWLVNHRHVSRIYFYQAKNLLENGKRLEALGIIDLAINSSPSPSREAYCVKGKIHLEMKQVYSALTIFIIVMKIDIETGNNNVDPDHNIREITKLALSMVDKNEIDLVSQLIKNHCSQCVFREPFNFSLADELLFELKKNKNYSVIYCMDGEALLKKELFGLAIKAFDQAIQLDPTDDHGYYSRGISYLKLKKTDLAIADFQKVMELKSSYFPHAQMALNQLSLSKQSTVTPAKVIDLSDEPAEIPKAQSASSEKSAMQTAALQLNQTADLIARIFSRPHSMYETDSLVEIEFSAEEERYGNIFEQINQMETTLNKKQELNHPFKNNDQLKKLGFDAEDITHLSLHAIGAKKIKIQMKFSAKRYSDLLIQYSMLTNDSYGFTYAQLNKIQYRDAGLDKLEAIKIHHDNLKKWGFSNFEILEIVSNYQGVKIINSLSEGYNIIKELGFNNHDMLKMFSHESGHQNISLMLKNYEKLKELRLDNEAIVQLFGSQPVITKKIIQFIQDHFSGLKMIAPALIVEYLSCGARGRERLLKSIERVSRYQASIQGKETTPSSAPKRKNENPEANPAKKRKIADVIIKPDPYEEASEINSPMIETMPTTTVNFSLQSQAQEMLEKEKDIFANTPSITEYNEIQFTRVARIICEYYPGDCSYQANLFLKFLRTGKEPEIKERRPNYVDMDMEFEHEYHANEQHSIIKTEQGAFGVVTHAAVFDASVEFPALVREIIPQTPGGTLDLDNPHSQLTIDNHVFERSAHYLKINETLIEEAKKLPHQVSSGFINIRRPIKLPYGLIAMTELEKPQAQTIEFDCDENGFSYRLLDKSGEVKKAECAWEALNLPEEFPKNRDEILRECPTVFLEYLFKLTNKLKHTKNARVPKSDVGHQLCYFLSKGIVYFIDINAYLDAKRENPRRKVATSTFIFSDLDQHYHFLSKTTGKKVSAKNKFCDQVYYYSFQVLPSELEQGIKLEENNDVSENNAMIPTTTASILPLTTTTTTTTSTTITERNRFFSRNENLNNGTHENRRDLRR